MPYTRAYTDEQLLNDALRFPNRKAWELAGDIERRAGTPSHYDSANKLGPEFMRRCTAHMTRAPRDYEKLRAYTDEQILASSSRFKTRMEWKRGDRNVYNAARYQAKHNGNPALWERCTAHMTAACNPFTAPSHVVYLCAIVGVDKVGYVGVTCRPMKRPEEHRERGPVFNYCQAEGVTFEFRVLQADLLPAAASKLEGFWDARYRADGWTLLNRARSGSLGSLRRVSFDQLLERAMRFETRTEFLRGDQSAYKRAKKYGWFDEIVAHMRDQAEVRSEAQMGHSVSAGARQKMRAAKVGRVLTDEHRKKIGAGLRSSTRYTHKS